MSTNIFNKVIICLLSALTLYQLTSCNIFQPDTAIPTYLRVSSPIFKNNLDQSQQDGDTTSNITDIWVYADNNPEGVYDVPALFPLLAQGKTLIQLSPGVEENGISNTRAIYPFYTYDTTTMYLQPKQTSAFTPHFTYRSGVQFAVNCNFEQGSDFQNYGGYKTSMAILKGSPVKYGKGCGYIHLSTDSPVYQGISSNPFTLPGSGGVWLEMDFMCTVSFNVGLTGINSPGDTSTPFINSFIEGLNPRSSWTKIYINLTNAVQATSGVGANTYQLTFSATLPSGTPTGQIYLDNVKVVYIPQ